MDKLATALFMSVIMFIMVVIMAFVFAFVTKFAWSGSIAQIFHLPELSFIQAFWLNVFGGMVFKSTSMSHSK